ncbi:MAG: hypothetical protein DI585_03190 [Pseudomonas fluorescens]|nr:MAG: hypothetical protein DI585_03190 [Pseudomonas fluorescens]
MKSQYVKARSIAVCSLVTTLRRETLVGATPQGRLAFLCATQQGRDLGNPHTTLSRAETSLLRGNAKFEYVMNHPLAVCVNIKTRNIATQPDAGSHVELYYVYRKSVQSMAQMEALTKEFLNPRLVPENYFHKQRSYSGDPSSVYNYARSRFQSEYMWPDAPGCLKDTLPFGTLEEQLKRLGFAPEFIASQARQNDLRTDRLSCVA